MTLYFSKDNFLHNYLSYTPIEKVQSSQEILQKKKNSCFSLSIFQFTNVKGKHDEIKDLKVEAIADTRSRIITPCSTLLKLCINIK